MNPLRRILAMAILLVGTFSFVFGDLGWAQETPRVLVSAVTGAITPVTADHVAKSLAHADRGGYSAVVLRVDTPGGLDTAMRNIVQDILASPVPVIVYVAPAGARAASAGAIIAAAAHVAAMAPGTTIGAATPVGLEGGDAGRKAINDAAAYAESLARLRGRNVEFAIDTVRKGRSVSANEAVAIHAVDVLARSIPGLLALVDGRTLQVGTERHETTLRTADARTDDFDMSLFQRARQLLADPNLAFLFLSIGALAILYELANPGIGAAGFVGVIMLLLAFFALSVLPVNATGLLLLGLAVALFVAELFAPGIGIAAAGGTLALALSGLFLIDDTPGLGVNLAVVLPVAIVVGAAVVLAGLLVVRSRHARVTTGAPALTGRVVTARRAQGTRGQAFLDGAWWNVRSTGPPLRTGDELRVVRVEGLDLVVGPMRDAADDDRVRPDQERRSHE